MPTASGTTSRPTCPGRRRPPSTPAPSEPVGPEDLAPLFPMALIEQEVSSERYIEIPEEVLEIYKLWRPTPLLRAHRLEKALDTPAHIYYKYEGASPAGSHKPNTAVAQAYYNKQEGINRLTTETGAGQWGSALAMACTFFGLELKVYMVKVSYHQKPYRRVADGDVGREGGAQPQPRHPGRPRHPGARTRTRRAAWASPSARRSEDAAGREDTKYSLGSVLNHVLLHQTVIGQEAIKQMEMAGEYPDVVIGCVGGGSNFAGLALPFVRDRLAGQEDPLRRRRAGGLPQHHPRPVRLRLRRHGRHDAAGDDVHPGPHLRAAGHPRRRPALPRHGADRQPALPRRASWRAGPITRPRSSRPPCSSRGPRASSRRRRPPTPSARAIDEALAAREAGEPRVILFNLSGHGLLRPGRLRRLPVAASWRTTPTRRRRCRRR